MKRIYGNLATVAALLLISILAASAQSSVPATDSMTAGQARRAIIESSTYMRVWANQSGGSRVDRNSIRFTSDTFEYDVTTDNGREHHTVDLKTVEVFDIVCQKVGGTCI